MRYTFRPRNISRNFNKKMQDTFETVYSVPMECESCVDSVKQSLLSIDGVKSYNVNLALNTVEVRGLAPPSKIVEAIRGIGKDAILRGAGKPDSAAVCILELFDPQDIEHPVKGLARFVSPGPNKVFVDLTVNGLSKGTYFPLIRTSGNLSKGAFSTGSIFHAFAPIEVIEPSSRLSTINSIGAFETDSQSLFSGQSFLLANLDVKNLIGRSMVLSKLENGISDDSLCGVIARSAGVWENDKTVCSCSGKTMWQEREDAIKRGIQS